MDAVAGGVEIDPQLERGAQVPGDTRVALSHMFLRDAGDVVTISMCSGTWSLSF